MNLPLQPDVRSVHGGERFSIQLASKVAARQSLHQRVMVLRVVSFRRCAAQDLMHETPLIAAHVTRTPSARQSLPGVVDLAVAGHHLLDAFGQAALLQSPLKGSHMRRQALGAVRGELEKQCHQDRHADGNGNGNLPGQSTMFGTGTRAAPATVAPGSELDACNFILVESRLFAIRVRFPILGEL